MLRKSLRTALVSRTSRTFIPNGSSTTSSKGDAGWEPLLVTPPHLENPSAQTDPVRDAFYADN